MDLAQDKKLVREAQKNPEAFGLLYDKFYKQIFNYILRRTSDIDAAKDITSQTFLKALKGLGKFRWQNVPFSAWLYRIAINEINSFYRGKKMVKINLDNIPEIASSETASQGVEEKEAEKEIKKDFKILHESIKKIAPIYQTVITLRYFEKKNICEICQVLGKAEGTVKSQIHRAVKELREIMKKTDNRQATF
jgi:RNA polymerase sigma-70 factor, ECF subfamily